MNWVRVNKSHPCPVCEKQSWCTVSSDGTVAKCTRIAEGSFKSSEDGAGLAHFHQLREPVSVPDKTAERPPEIDAEKIARETHRAFSVKAPVNEARRLGVSPGSLMRMRVGWSFKHKAYTYPMRDSRDKIIGVRLRSAQGRKWAVPGSINGLFVPRMLTDREPLFVVEGPTDCAALLTLGLNVIGRPSDTAGTDLLALWIKASGYRHIAIALEANEPGTTADVNARRGANTLRQRLADLGSVESVSVFLPDGGKDVREWVQSGGTKEQVLNAAREAAKRVNGAAQYDWPRHGRPTSGASG